MKQSTYNRSFALLETRHLPMTYLSASAETISMVAIALWDRNNSINQQYTYLIDNDQVYIALYLCSNTAMMNGQLPVYHLWYCPADGTITAIFNDELTNKREMKIDDLPWANQEIRNNFDHEVDLFIHQLSYLDNSENTKLRQMFVLPNELVVDRRKIGLDDQAIKLCEYLESHSEVATAEVTTLFKVSPHRARAILRTLMARKLVERVGNAWTTRYRWIAFK